MLLLDLSLVLKGKSEQDCDPWLRARIAAILKLPGDLFAIYILIGFVNAEWWLRDPEGKKEREAVLYTLEFKVDSKENVDNFMKEETKEAFGNFSHSTRVLEFVQDFFDPEKLTSDFDDVEEPEKIVTKPKDKPVPPPAGKKPPAPPPGAMKPGPKPPSNDATRFPPIFDRSAKGIKEVPTDEIVANPHLTKLNLMRNQLTNLPDALSVLGQLDILDLSHNSFENTPDVIAQMAMLTQLDFTDNLLTDNGVTLDFASMQYLTKVSLFDNKLTTFPLALAECPQLVELNLGRNQITVLPSEIQTMTNLQKLNVSHNNLTALPSEIGYCVNLINLNLDRNKLTALPAELTFCYILIEVSFKRNLIKEIPENYRLEAFQQLQLLDLSGNQLVAVPDGFFELSSESDYIALQELSLQNNKINSVTKNIQNATYLSYLNLSTNEIAEFPNICSLTSLIQVKLSSNRLTSIPAEVSALNQLETLDLFNNQLVSLPASVFSMPIIQLYLAFNQIEELGELAMEDLEELNISHNKLKALPASIVNSRRLKELHVNGNRLKELPARLDALEALIKCDFSHNELTELPEEICALKDLQSVLASHNKLQRLPPVKPDSLLDLFVADFSGNALSLDETWLSVAKRADVLVDGHVALGHVAPAELSQRWTVVSSEVIGRRPTQEDAFLLAGNLGGNRNVDLFGVFDGHAGSVASRYAARNFAQAFLRAGGGRAALESAFTTINKEIEELLHRPDVDLAERHCGTTALACLIQDNKLLCANVGDTRAVICRSGRAERLSIDHKPRSEVDRVRALGGHVIVMGGETERINGLLAVARSLGDFFMKPFVTEEPYLREYELSSEDEFLILACDGVWDELADQKAVDLYRAEAVPSLAAEKLRDFAYGCGSDDNISVLVVDFRHKK